jgi:tRNA(fMet)-specific endonuclease VapC
MVILDTDLMSLLDRRENDAQLRLQYRLDALPADQVVTTIITFEEQMRGWMAYLAKSRGLTQQIKAYERLSLFLEQYSRRRVLRFEEQAATELERLQRLRLRIGTMDLKIAAIALANNATVLTRNRKDFDQIPGLKVEDWSV